MLHSVLTLSPVACLPPVGRQVRGQMAQTGGAPGNTQETMIHGQDSLPDLRCRDGL